MVSEINASYSNDSPTWNCECDAEVWKCDDCSRGPDGGEGEAVGVE